MRHKALIGRLGNGQLPAIPVEIEETARPRAAYQRPDGLEGGAVEGGLLEYLGALRRRKASLLLCSGLGLVAGVVLSLPQSPVYQAKTVLEVVELNDNFMNMKEVQQMAQGGAGGASTDIQTQLRILQSESLVDRTLHALQYRPADEGSEQSGALSKLRRLFRPETGERKLDARNAALLMAARQTKVRASGQTRIIEVTVDSTDRNVAADYANRLVQEFITGNMTVRWQVTQKTGEFIARQLEEMRSRLEKSEAALQGYARRNGLIFTSERTNVSEDKLRQLQTELTKTTTARVNRQSRWEMASNVPADSLPDVLNDASLRDYQTKLAELRRQLAELAETYTADHLRVRRVEAQIVALESSLSQQRSDILLRIRNEYDEAVRREKLILADYRDQTGVVTDQSEKAIQYNMLKREVDTNRQIYDNTLQRMKEVSVASALRASNIRVVDPAKAPKLPYRPNVNLNALLGLLCGTSLGVVMLVMKERADRTVQNSSDIACYLSVPELGVIPKETDPVERLGWLVRKDGMRRLTQGGVQESGGPDGAMVACRRRPSVMAESFRAVLASIVFGADGARRPRVLVVTSPSPGEGKTTVAANLAIVMAETGQRVLLIDADTRRPMIHTLFGIPRTPGLTDLLPVGRLIEPDAAVVVSAVPKLYLLPAGTEGIGDINLANAAELKRLIANYQVEFDMVVIDTPPVMLIPDARIIGRLAHGVVLVVRSGQTTRDAAAAVRDRLREDGTHVLGTVLNDWNPRRGMGGYYGYYKGYGTSRTKT
jgi:capsular exopolysaccharide synthesis family protein